MKRGNERKEMRKKIFAATLAAVMSIALLTGCADNGESVGNTSLPSTEEKQEASILTETDKASDQTTEENKRVVIDHRGKEVELPANVERIVITSITPLPSVYALMGADLSKIVGISESAKSAAQDSILADIYPEILEISTDFTAGNEVNVEEILAMDPDVVFFNISSVEEGEKYETAGIPAVAFSTTAGDTPIEIFEGWVTLLGDVLGTEDRAQEIVAYGEEIITMISERLQETGDSLVKPKVLYIYSYDDGRVFTTGSTHHGERWADATGAVNVGGGVETQKYEVTMEQIYEWNPDIIYIASTVSFLPKDFYNNSIEGADWSNIKAVKEGKVYRCPLGTYHWYPPSADSPLMLVWQAQHNQPELFSDIDLEEMTTEYFRRFYQVELTDETLEKIFNAPR